jgi:SagB-type dehydrogenase family enzyme
LERLPQDFGMIGLIGVKDRDRRSKDRVRFAEIALVLFAVFLLVSFPLARGEPSAGNEPPEEKVGIGERFHRDTSLTWGVVVGDLFRIKPKKPPAIKTFPGARRMKLPLPEYRGITVEEAIRERRSVRNFAGKPITIAQLSQLLFAAQGITGEAFRTPLRAAPSAGALYPYEIYLVINDVEGVPRGIYHYAVLEHALELVEEGDYSGRITRAGLDQEMLGESNVTFVLAAVFDRVRHKYGERGVRYVYIEAGHLSQNIALQAVSMGLGSVTVGAFVDTAVNRLIGVDGRGEAAIYLHAIGAR